jgi:hypothetical protein
MRPVMSKALLASVFALAAAVPVLSLSGCSPEVPANPTYTEHVKPIFMARCVRCHDETLRGEPMPNGQPGKVPAICHLNRYGNEPMGCTSAAPPCSLGASACANLPGMGSYLAGKVDPAVADDPARMPPPPAPALNDYESAVVNRWLTNLDANGAPLP